MWQNSFFAVAPKKTKKIRVRPASLAILIKKNRKIEDCSCWAREAVRFLRSQSSLDLTSKLQGLETFLVPGIEEEHSSIRTLDLTSFAVEQV